MLNPNQIKYLRLHLFLLGGWGLTSMLLYPLFNVGVALTFFAGGVLYLLSCLSPGLIYFSFRGAQQANLMVSALKLGALAKFVLVIVFFSLFATSLPSSDLLLPLTLGVIAMHFAHAFGAAGALG